MPKISSKGYLEWSQFKQKQKPKIRSYVAIRPMIPHPEFPADDKYAYPVEIVVTIDVPQSLHERLGDQLIKTNAKDLLLSIIGAKDCEIIIRHRIIIHG